MNYIKNRAAEIVRQWNYSDADDRTIVATLTDDGLMVIEGSGYCNPPVVELSR